MRRKAETPKGEFVGLDVLDEGSVLALLRICPTTLAIIAVRQRSGACFQCTTTVKQLSLKQLSLSNKFGKHNICSGNLCATSSLTGLATCGCGIHTFPVLQQPVDDKSDADPVRGLLCSSHSPILPLVHSAPEHQAGVQLRPSFGPTHSDPSRIWAGNMRCAFRLQLPFLSSSRS